VSLLTVGMCCQEGELGTDIILLSTQIPRRGMLKRMLYAVSPKGVRRPIRGATVYIVRIDKQGNLAMARPCESCMLELVKHRIKRIIYSVPKGYVVETIDYGMNRV
jgi:hypothetical protein